MIQMQTSWSANRLKIEIPPAYNSDKAVIFLFFDSTHDTTSLVEQLRKSHPKAHVVGCSGSGQIQGSEIIDERILVHCALFESSTSRLKSVSHPIEKPEGSFGIGEKISRDLAAPDLKGVFVLSEGLNINGTSLIQGILSLNKSLTVSGGLAGDAQRFANTFTVHNGPARKGQVVALGLYGPDIQYDSLAMGGWSPFGVQRKVTKSVSNILYEIDHQPALELYQQFLGKDAQHLPGSALLFPLLIENHPDLSSRNLVRTILNTNEADKSMVFAGDIPEGATIRLMKASLEEIVAAASRAGLALKQKTVTRGPALSIAISCVGRRMILGESTEDEPEAITEHLGPGSFQTGFYSYGELAPSLGGFCDLHNQTMTLTWITEGK